MASYRKIKTGWQYIISYKDNDGRKRQKTGSEYRTKSEAKQVAEPLEIEIKRMVISQIMMSSLQIIITDGCIRVSTICSVKKQIAFI